MTATAAPATAPRGLDRLARAGTANLVGAAVSGLCTFGLTVAITRGVPRAEAGVFFSATSVFLIAITVGQLGTQTGLVYFVARARAARHGTDSDRYLRNALPPVLLVGAAMAIAMFALARPLAELTSAGHVDAAASCFRVLAPFIPVAGLELVMLAGTRGLGTMRASALVEQIGRPLAQLTLVTIATAATSSALLGLAWSIAYLPAAVAAVLAWRTVRSRQPETEGTGTGAVTQREFWRFTLPRALTNILQMVMQRFDIVLVGAMAGVVQAAVYAAATRFIVVGQLATNALTMAAQPQLAARLSAGDRDGVNDLYQTSTAWLMLVTWPMYLSMIVLGKPLLLVFGHGYTTGRSAIVIIACSMLVSTGLGLVDTVLAMAGRTSWNLGNAALALTVNLVVDVLLIPGHGIVGAAIGWAAAIVVRNVSAAVQISLRLGLRPFGAPAVVAAALATVCYGGTALVVIWFLGQTPLALAVSLAGATAVYLPGLRILGNSLRLDALGALRRRHRPRERSWRQ